MQQTFVHARCGPDSSEKPCLNRGVQKQKPHSDQRKLLRFLAFADLSGQACSE